MANTFIKGNEVVITLWKDAEAPLIAGCNTTDVVGLDTEFIEITPISGYFKNYIPTYIGGTLSFDSVVFIEGASPEQAGINRHLSNLLNRQELNFSIRWSSGAVGGGLDGTCYIQNISITGAVNNYATGNISLIISGEITLYEDYS
jgi:hypothetical protein